ncbi:MAG: Gfo/Idh/MocA family oxidoreductase [Fimbriimonadaceae bacterium]|nr:Gfo/Idh/MocA family oxidoreductase [Fimbriimonadaceae bacterium]
MAIRLGLITAAHVHTPGYVAGLARAAAGPGALPAAVWAGIWDHDAGRGEAFAAAHGLPIFGQRDALIAACDAVVITSENRRHAEHLMAAMAAGRHVLCEKPVVTTAEEAARVRAAAAAMPASAVLMTAFPCRYAPGYAELVRVLESGRIGRVRAIAATNRGTCPHGWFTDAAESGGGALMDHVVHVADVVRHLPLRAPTSDDSGADAREANRGHRPNVATRIRAQVGTGMYGGFGRATPVEDVAMLTIDLADGPFVTLDASWSRPAAYRTWGDVMITVVGDAGVIEVDLFGQEVQRYGAANGRSHAALGFGADLDAAMMREFLTAIGEGRPARTTLEDGIAAAEWAMEAGRAARVSS